MSEIYVIGDTHFGHANILRYSRPFFQSIEEHDEALVELWNSVVSPSDNVIHLGDVAFGAQNLKYIAECNGSKKLILGNHDGYHREYPRYFNKTYGSYTRWNILFTHMPVIWDYHSRYKYIVHGHIHKKEREVADSRYLNVNADVIGLIPMHIEEVFDVLKGRTKND